MSIPLSDWAHFLKELLKGAGEPAYLFSRDGGDFILSAANLWTLALERKKLFRSLGVKPGDVIREHPQEFEGLINLVACSIGGYVYWPESAARIVTAELIPADKERGAADPRIWMPSSGVGFSSKTVDGVSFHASPDLQSIVTHPDVVFLLSSSGTQAQKIIGLTGAGTIHQLISHATKLDLRRSDSRLCVLPHSHAFGLVLDLLLGSYARQSVYLFSKGALSSRVLLQAISERDIRHLAVVPRMLELLLSLSKEEGKESLKAITIHTGGATVSHPLRVLAREQCDALVLGYGLTECGPGVLIDGAPVGCSVKLSEAGSANCRESFSELLVKTESQGVFSAEDTVTSDGFVRTGDLARYSQGQFEILGRSGQSLKTTSGTWISNGELESLVAKRFGVPCALGVSESVDNLSHRRIIFLGVETARINQELVAKFVESKIGYDLPCSFLGETQNIIEILDGSIAKSTEDAIRAMAKVTDHTRSTA